MHSSTKPTSESGLAKAVDLRKQGRYKDALRTLNSLDQVENGPARLEKVRLLWDIGNGVDAWTAGSDLLERNFTDIDLLVLRGEIQLGLGQASAAMESSQLAIGRNARYAPALALRAGALRAAGRDTDAQQAVRAALELDPCNLEALVRTDLLDPAEAIPSLNTAHRRRPHDWKVAAYVAITLSGLGKLVEARAILDNVSQANRMCWEVRVATTLCRAVAGDSHEALAEANMLLAELDCCHSRSLRALSLILESRFVEALEDLDAALAQMPGDIEILHTRAQVRAAEQSWSGVLRDASVALDLGPARTDIRVLRAHARIVLNRPDLALRDLNDVLGREPTHAEALTLRAEVRLLGGNAEGALADAELALTTAEPTVDLLQLRGLAQGALGRIEQARVSFLMVLQLDPGNELAIRSLTPGQQPGRDWAKIGKTVLSVASSGLSIAASLAGLGGG